MAAAELKLQVGLDLAFFRQQLAQLASTSVGYSLPINIDRLAIQKEITKLGKNISNRSYTLQVKTTAKIAEAEVDKLKEALDKLQGKEVGIKITGTLGKIAPKDATKIRNDLAEAVTGGAGKKILVDVSVRENAIGEELRAVRKALNEKITPKNGKILVAASIRNGITNEEAKEFRESVKRKVGNIIVNVTGSADQLRAKEAKSIRTSLYQSIVSNGGKIKIPATLTIANSEVAAFQKAVNSQFAGITVKIKAEVEGASSFAQGSTGTAGLEKHLQTQGLSGGNYADVGRRVRLREQLKTKSKAQLLELAKQEGLARYSKLNKDPLIERLVQEITSETAERILGNVQNMLRNAGGGGSSSAIGKMLDTLARGVFHMLGMDPAAMMAAQKQKLLPPSISWPASAATPPSYQGKPGTMLPGAPAPTLIGGAPGPFGLLPRTTRAGAMGDMRRMLSQGAGEEQPGKLALSPEAAKARVDAIIGQYLRVVEVQIKEAFSAPAELKKQLNVFSYLAQSLRDAEQRAKQSKIDSAVDGLINALESLIRNAQLRLGIRGVSIADLGANRPLLAGTSYPALPSAGETGKNRVRISTGNPFQSLPMLPAAGETGKDRVRIRTGQNLNIPFVAPQIPSAQVNRGVSSAGPTGRVEGRGASPYAFEKGFGSPEALAIENAAKQTLRLGLATDVAQRSLGKMNASQIPFIGGLRGVAGELGQATKQVLLYGTAYRALAAITSIPGQILDAAKSQQQYTNGLKVATQETGTFAKELLFVDNVQRAFGLNLETTRTGFTRLYASMAPTGFDSGSIEKLFTGISAATAALQLTPDKAERVIYAFGQMASKGQIMSEELKGQLGDVLPGALAIFAKSAGMSVKEFSKAMEDGEFVGNRFREVFAKVSDELMNRFGTGAQAAGKSLQGLLSTVGGDVQRTLESFAPLANAAAQATLLPLAGMLRDVSMAAQIAMGEQDRVKKQLEDSRKDVSALKVGGASAKEIKAAEDNVAALAVQYEVLNEAAKDPAIAQQVKNIEAFVTEVQKAATFTMNLAGVIGNVLSPFITVLGGNLTSVIGNLTLLVLGFNAARLAVFLYMGAMSATAAVAGITRGGAVGATLLAGAFRLLGAQATAANVATGAFGLTVRGLLISTGVGALVVLIGSLAAAFLSVGDKAKEAADRAKQSIDSMTDAARTGNVSLITNELSVNKAERQDVENLIAKIEKLKTRVTSRGGESSVQEVVVDLTPELQREAKRRLGAEFNNSTNKSALLASLNERRKLLKEENTSGQESLIAAQKRAKLLGLNKPTPDAAKDEKDPKKKQNLESYYKLEDDLAKAVTQGEIDKANMLFEHRKNLMDTYYDLQDARANSFQKATIRFQREVANIEMERQKNVLNARNAVRKAEGSVAGGTSGGTGAIFGDTGRTFNAKGFVHGHFQNQNREALVQDTVETVMGLLGKGVSPELGSGARFTSGMNTKQVEALVRQGIGSHKQYASGASAVDVFVPKGTQVPVPVSGIQNLGGAGGFAGSLARGSQLMHLDPASRTQGVGAARKVTGNESRDINAAQKTQIELDKENLALRQANVLAIEKQKIAMENYVAEIMPLAEQKLQNQLLAQRNQLQLSGAGDAEIEQKTKAYELDYRRLDLEKTINALRQKKTLTDVEAAQLKTSAAALAELNEGYDEYIANLAEARRLRAESSYSSNMDSLRKQLQLASILDPYDEQRQKYIQEDQSPEQADAQVQAQKQVDAVTKLRDSYRELASTIGEAFSSSFKGIIDGSMTAQQALGSFFQNVGNYFIDMAAKMIAEWIKVEALEGIKTILSAFGGGAAPAAGGAGIAGGQGIFTAANGGIAAGGFRAFATGGIVTGPTLGLVGEGKYNEAVIPLPDGKSVPVDLGGMSGGGAITSNIVINISSDGQSSSNANGSNSAELGRKIEGAVKQVMVAELRPGGILAGRR